jgi:hypothetical protein
MSTEITPAGIVTPTRDAEPIVSLADVAEDLAQAEAMGDEGAVREFRAALREARGLALGDHLLTTAAEQEAAAVRAQEAAAAALTADYAPFSHVAAQAAQVDSADLYAALVALQAQGRAELRYGFGWRAVDTVDAIRARRAARIARDEELAELIDAAEEEGRASVVERLVDERTELAGEDGADLDALLALPAAPTGITQAEADYLTALATVCQETHDAVADGGTRDYLAVLEDVAANLNLLAQRRMAFQS